MTTFPKDFLFGGATAGAYGQPRQITLTLKDGSLGSAGVRDALPAGSVPTLFNDTYYPSHQATDFYHHWREDIDLLAALGSTTYRFSICWSRIFQLV